jgi:hypothetical protein
VWVLTVTADGAVPLAHRVVDGNTSDDVTHVDTWDHLVALLGRTDFLYVADCKLATRDTMVGCTNAPLAGTGAPHETAVAPASTAASICALIPSAAPWVDIGGTVVSLSNGSPGVLSR